MVVAAGEDESPDSHLDRGVPEDARFSGLTVTLRAHVQMVQETGGYLGPSPVDS